MANDQPTMDPHRFTATAAVTSTTEGACNVGEPAKAGLRANLGRTADGLLCLRWDAAASAGEEYEVTLEYPREPSKFTYRVDRSVTEFVFPAQDQPRLRESVEQCFKRKEFVATVAVTGPSGRLALGGVGIDSECPGP